MLFDLRGGKRRRTIQAVYLSLAILMGGGLVLFGIGGEVQGGLFDAFRNEETATEDLFEERIKTEERRVGANPQNAVAWAALAKLHFQQAGTGENFDQNTGAFTDGGRAELRQSSRAWQRYLALKPKQVDDSVASLMVQAYVGLNQLDRAVQAMEIVVEEREPTPQLFAQLATYAYAAGQTRKGDLAREKALELAPKEDREQIKAQLDAAKQQGAQATSQNGASTTG